MITKAQAIAVAKDFIQTLLPRQQWFSHIRPHICAILLYGSTAKGTNHENSDIDILIILPLAVEETYTTGEYFYTYDGHTINIVLRSIERLRNIAEEGTDPFQKEVFRGSVVLQKSDDEIDELLSTIARIAKI